MSAIVSAEAPQQPARCNVVDQYPYPGDAVVRLVRVSMLLTAVAHSVCLAVFFRLNFDSAWVGRVEQSSAGPLSLFLIGSRSHNPDVARYFLIAHIATSLHAARYWRSFASLLAAIFFSLNLFHLVWFAQDGGTNLAQICLIYLAGACSVGSGRLATDRGRRLRGAVANHCALWLIRGQIALMYLVAAVSKLQGKLWRNGTALLYILQNDYFSAPWARGILLRWPELSSVGCYAAIAFQLMFVFLVWTKGGRIPLLLGGVAFHVAIGASMHLSLFSLTMIASYTAFLRDDEAAGLLRILWPPEPVNCRLRVGPCALRLLNILVRVFSRGLPNPLIRLTVESKDDLPLARRDLDTPRRICAVVGATWLSPPAGPAHLLAGTRCSTNPSSCVVDIEPRAGMETDVNTLLWSSLCLVTTLAWLAFSTALSLIRQRQRHSAEREFVAMTFWCLFLQYMASHLAPPWPYLPPIIIVLACARSLFLRQHGDQRRTLGELIGTVFNTALLVAFLGLMSFESGTVPSTPVELASPLVGLHIVAKGGSSRMLNHHVIAPMQRWALDIMRPHGWKDFAAMWGRRAQDFSIYGEVVRSPCAGTLSAVDAGQIDQELGHTDPEHPLGNHVILECRDSTPRVRLRLAHLAAGSVTLRVGDDVAAAQPLGRVGNSGNTSMPHLHIDAQRVDGTSTAVPLAFGGNTLRAFDVIRDRDEMPLRRR